VTAPSTDLLALPAEAQDLLFRVARTARAFTAEPVTDDQVRAIHELIRYGPTSFDTQPMRVLLVRSPAARERLLRHVVAGNRPRVAAAPLVAVLAAAGDGPDAMFNAALQIGYFIVGVRAAGLAAGPMAGFDRAGVDAEFLAARRWHSLLLVNIGRPAPGALKPRRPRLPYAEVVQAI
jgi:3-hydroxypropanoate dehydrogenase